MQNIELYKESLTLLLQLARTGVIICLGDLIDAELIQMSGDREIATMVEEYQSYLDKIGESCY